MELRHSTPWPPGSVYVSSLLTSRRPPYIPFRIYFYVNLLINTLITLPITAYYIYKGKYVIHPGWHQGWLEEAAGPDVSNDDTHQQQLVNIWLDVVEQDVSVVILGWRAGKSTGAMQEAQLARELGLEVREWTGVLHSPA